MNKLEFYKQREEKRESLKSDLPIDKQLEGRLGKTKWKFETPLRNIRKSESPSDRYFIEKLRQSDKDSSPDHSLDALKELKEKEEKELITNLEGEIFYIKGMNDCDSSVQQGTAQSLGVLVAINPELYARLCEKGINDRALAVRQRTAQSLSALAAINPELYIQLYEKGMNDRDPDVRREITRLLGALAAINSELYARLCEKGMNDENWNVRHGTAQSLGALAAINPELYARLCEEGINDRDLDVRREITRLLGALAAINPELYARLCEKGMNNENWAVRHGTAQSLSALAAINPELYARLCEKGMNDENWDVRHGAAQSLSALAAINPELYIQLYEKGVNNRNSDVCRGAAQSLGALAAVNPELYARLCEEGMSNENWSVREGTAKSISALAAINPELYARLCEKGVNDKDSDVRRETTQSLGALAAVNPELYARLCEEGMNNENWSVRHGAAQSLGALAAINPELYARLCEEGMNDRDLDVRREITRLLGALAAINSELYARLCEKGMNDRNPDVRQRTAKSLSALAAVNPELYARLCEEGMNNENWAVRHGTAQSLSALAAINPELYARLCEKGMNDRDPDVRLEITRLLGALAAINPELYARLCEEDMNDRDLAVRQRTAQSLGALAAINPELYVKLYKNGIHDGNSDVRRETAQSLGALAAINPELYVKLYKNGIHDGNSDVRGETSQSLKSYPFKENALTKKVTKIISAKTDDSNNIFVLNLLPKAIGEHNPAQVWEYLETLNKTRDYLEESNKQRDAVKQIDSVKQFFADSQLELSNLAKIFSPKNFGVFLTTVSADSLLYTKSFLEIARPIYENKAMSASLRQYLDKQPLKNDEIEKLFETGAQFAEANLEDQFISIIDQGGNVQSALDRKLLDIVASGVDIDSSSLPDDSLSRWNTPYLAYLGSNNKIIEGRIASGEDNYENVQMLYKKIVEHGFIGDFKQFILETNQDDEIGSDLAGHNKEVFRQFRDLGIDTDAWYDYQGVRDFLVSKEIKVDNLARFRTILEERAAKVGTLLEEIKDELTPRQYEPLRHILDGAKNKGLKDITDHDELRKQFQSLNERITKIKQESFPDSKTEYFGTLFEHLGHLEEAIDLFKKENRLGTETKEQGFRIKLWDRDPARDLFQGNYTHCCIAVGVKDAPQEGGLYTHDPATVAQFLADGGIQVAEVYDQERKDPIANTWLFVSKDRNGEPILVLDNVEVNNRCKDTNVNTAIRDNLFAFVREFARKCNIPKVGIGMVGTNDIEWQSLDKMMVAPVDKVGGYLEKYTSSGGTRAGRYYLEAYNAQALGEIYDEEKQAQAARKKEKKERKKEEAGVITIIDLDTGAYHSMPNTESSLQSFANRRNLSYDDIAESLNDIESGSFSSSLAESPEDIINTIGADRGVSFIFMEDNKIVGYLNSLRADQFTPIVSHPEYSADRDALYINSIAGKVDPYQTIQKLKAQAEERGYKKIVMHGINPRLNAALIRYGFVRKATIPDWAGHQADYMELALEGE